MKLLCCSKFFLLFLLFLPSLYGSIKDKSAIFYEGNTLSYSMVGIHDYIILSPEKTNTLLHGFDLYKEKIYAKITVNSIEEAQTILHNAIKKGFKNFFFKTSHTIEIKDFYYFINTLHHKYPKTKILIESSTEIITPLTSMIEAIVVESFVKKDIQDLQEFGLDIIDIEFVELDDLATSKNLIKKIKSKGMIPYITNHNFTIYGKSSKNAIKREVFTLIDESKLDRMLQSSHQHGALPLEYMGYIQKLYNVEKGLPSIEEMLHYAGVVIWLRNYYEDSDEFLDWIQELISYNIKVVFINNFGTEVGNSWLEQLQIEISDATHHKNNKNKIIQRDPILGFETEPSANTSDLYMMPKNATPIYTYEDSNAQRSVPAAITPWGGYALYEAMMAEFNNENIWIMNPFEFFRRTLRLKKIPVPDTTTENGMRLMFTHVDGDGIMNYVEFNPKLYSGDIIYNEILKKYNIPHSVSVIGAEIDTNGLFKKIAPRLQNIAKKIYALPNVEAATHTYSHPFKWDKIHNNHLNSKYRLQVKNYKFSLHNELVAPLEFINNSLLPQNKPKAKTVFWSGNCMPQTYSLEFIYKHKLLNINGGDTTITNKNPWLTNVSPLGIERDGYYQVYTGAQNENVFTNDWLGPFWGFKNVVQTFQLTNTPRRLKPIDIYYHLYSGSKIASLNALKYVLDWSLKQDVMPIYTSSYIPKVMDYFNISIAHNKNKWLIDGMRDLKTLRIESKKVRINLKKSKTTLGLRFIQDKAYISLDQHQRHYIHFGKAKKEAYLISSNAKVTSYKKGKKHKKFLFEGHIDLKLSFYLPKKCSLNTEPKANVTFETNNIVSLKFKNHKKAVINVSCK